MKSKSRQVVNWDGPISVALFVDRQSQQAVNFLYNVFLCDPAFSQKISLHVVFRLPAFSEQCPPLIITPQSCNVITENYKGFANQAKKLAKTSLCKDCGNLIAIRRFELESKVQKVPRTVKDLRAHIDNKTVFEFHQEYFPAGHTIPGLWHWFNVSNSTQEPFVWEIPYKGPEWEPQVIMHSSAPYSEEDIPTRWRDQQALAYELCRANYTFLLASHLFNIHRGVKRSSGDLDKAVQSHQSRYLKQYLQRINKDYPNSTARRYAVVARPPLGSPAVSATLTYMPTAATTSVETPMPVAVLEAPVTLPSVSEPPTRKETYVKMRQNRILDNMTTMLEILENGPRSFTSKRSRLSPLTEVSAGAKLKTEVGDQPERKPKKEVMEVEDDEPVCVFEKKWSRKNIAPAVKEEIKEELASENGKVELMATQQRRMMDVSDCGDSHREQIEAKREIEAEAPRTAPMAGEEIDDDDCVIVLFKGTQVAYVQNTEDKPVVRAAVRASTPIEDSVVPSPPIEPPVASSTPVNTSTTAPTSVETHMSADVLETPGIVPRRVLYRKDQLARRAGGPPRDANGKMLRPLVPLPRLGSRKRDASGNTPLVPVPTAPSTPAPLPVNRDIHSYEAPLPLPFLGLRTSDASGNIRLLPEVDPIASSPTVLPPDEPLSVIGNAHSSKALPPLPYVGSASARRKAPVATPIPARVVRQMKRKEALGKTSIPRSEMLKIVKELSDKVTSENNMARHGWQSTAVDLVHEAAEIYLACLFEDAQLLAIHAKRKTVDLRDFKLLGLLRSNTFESHASFSSVNDKQK